MELAETLELCNLIPCIATTMHSAKNYKENHRAHAHKNYPDMLADKCMKHSLAYYDEQEGKTKIGYRPIHYYTLDGKTILPVARVY